MGARGLIVCLLLFIGGVSLKKLTNKQLADIYFNIDFAINYLYASSTSYCVTKDLEAYDCPPCKSIPFYEIYNMTVSTTCEGEPQKVLFMVDTKNRQIVVAFQGTHNPEQILDQAYNMVGMHYDLQDDLPDAIVDSYYLKTYNNGVFRESVEHNIKALTQKYPRYQVIFTGHSLGGALTLMAAFDSVKEGWIQVKEGSTPSPMIYTYGQPRPGNQVFQDAVNQLFEGKYFRITHHRDLIPHIPPCVPSLFYSETACQEGIGNDLMWYPIHAGIEIFFDGDTADNYVVCEAVEDQNCAMKYLGTSIADHLLYLGIKDNCPGDGDH